MGILLYMCIGAVLLFFAVSLAVNGIDDSLRLLVKEVRRIANNLVKLNVILEEKIEQDQEKRALSEKLVDLSDLLEKKAERSDSLRKAYVDNRSSKEGNDG